LPWSGNFSFSCSRNFLTTTSPRFGVPGDIWSEGARSKLCGVCPIPASSRKSARHGLNKGGKSRREIRHRLNGSIAGEIVNQIGIDKLRHNPPSKAS